MRHFLYVLVCVFTGVSCCYNPQPVVPETLPLVREATIAEFDPRRTGSVPAPEFNIATFEFPLSEQSSGSLPNDIRFADGPWRFQQTDFPRNGMTTRYEFRTPPNALISGDLIVDRIDLTVAPATAHIRVKGSLTRMPTLPNLLTDNAAIFAQEVVEYLDTARTFGATSICALLQERSVPFGIGIPDSLVGQGSIQVFENDAPSTIQYPVTWPRDSDGQLFPAIGNPRIQDVGYYSVDVRVGDWFYYRSPRGGSYFVLVTAIRQGEIPPFVRRMTFKFTEAYGCYDCE